MIDLYFDYNYGKLNEKIEGGVCEVFQYKSSIGTVRSMFIKREIPIKINKKNYFDIVTPYGYGGPLIIECVDGKKNELVKDFCQAFQQYCERNQIVSEFVRFHPIVENALDFSKYYNIFHIRNTVGTNLAVYEEPFQSEFSKSCRRNIRKALAAGVNFKITLNPNDIGSFKKIYYSTMNRNKAAEYYYFNDEYFSQCLDLLREHIVLVEAIYREQTIAMGLYFIYNKIIHIHLSGTLSEFLYLSPAYILRYAITIWGKERGYDLIHHGGGRSNEPEDGLYLFKKQFGRNTEFKYFIGKKVWNTEVYEQLCRAVGVDKNIEYFPAYRAIKGD
jgi:hypothetical protein